MNPHEKESSPRPPRSVILTVASRCNLRCRHCWPDCGPGAKPFFLSEDVFRRLVDEFAREGARSVTVTGGEPLLHPRWLSMLEFCRRHPGLDEVCLQTNGTLLTEDKVEALASLDGKELLVQVSLDGASAEAHDFVRGEGSFARALRGVELLVEKGLGRRTRLAFTEMAHNFDDLPRLLERVCEWGLKGLVSGTLVRSGRALEASGVSLPGLPSTEGSCIATSPTKPSKSATKPWAPSRPSSGTRGGTGPRRPRADAWSISILRPAGPFIPAPCSRPPPTASRECSRSPSGAFSPGPRRFGLPCLASDNSASANWNPAGSAPASSTARADAWAGPTPPAAAFGRWRTGAG